MAAVTEVRPFPYSGPTITIVYHKRYGGFNARQAPSLTYQEIGRRAPLTKWLLLCSLGSQNIRPLCIDQPPPQMPFDIFRVPCLDEL